MGKYKAWIMLGSGLVIALVTSILIYNVLQKRAVVKEEDIIQTQPVAAAMVDLGWGTVLKKEMIKTVPFLKDNLPPGCFSDPEALVGRVLVYPVKANEPIFESRLAPKDIKTGGVAAVISPKKRAVSVKVDKVIGVSGFIHAGNRVDVLVTVATGRTSNPTTKIVLENILVLAVGPETEKKGKEPVPVDVITLEVSPEEAEKLALSAAEGRLQLALRNFGDAEDVLTRGTTIPALLASYTQPAPPTSKTGPPRRVSSPRRATPAPAKTSTHVVELIKGGKVSEVKFERSE